MKRLSIGMRLTLSYLLIFLLAELLFGAGMWFILRKNLYDIADATLENQADDLRRFLEARAHLPAEQLQAAISDDYQIERSEDYVQISKSGGELVYQSNFLQTNPLPPIPLDRLRKPRYQTVRLHASPFRILSQKISVGGEVLLVRIGSTLDEEQETLDAFQKYLLLFAPLLLLAASGVGYWMSRGALAPVDALARTARTISGSNLSQRLESLHTGDELQRLSDTLNEMLARIESAFMRITEFTADASHELRTPLALIRTEAELALRRSRNEREYRDALQHILAESQRTSRLIDELLELARADSGSEILTLLPADLLAIVRDRFEKWIALASLRDLKLVWQGDSAGGFNPMPVMGDESALRRVIDILLENAVKYTPSPGAIALSAQEIDGNAVISVADSGIGIAPEDQARIFERFYRVDKARSRAMGGAGLGLAIARWIVQRHQGSIGVHSDGRTGATFRVEIPMTTTADPAQAAAKSPGAMAR